MLWHIYSIRSHAVNCQSSYHMALRAAEKPAEGATSQIPLITTVLVPWCWLEAPVQVPVRILITFVSAIVFLLGVGGPDVDTAA